MLSLLNYVVILQSRIYAMYRKNKVILFFNGLVFLMEIVVMLMIYNVGLAHPKCMCIVSL